MISFIENVLTGQNTNINTLNGHNWHSSALCPPLCSTKKTLFWNLHFTFDRRQSKSHANLIKLNNNTANENKNDSLDFVDFHNLQRLDVSRILAFFTLYFLLICYFCHFRVCVCEWVCLFVFLYEFLLKLFCWILFWDASIDARRFVRFTWIGIFVEFDSLFEFFRFLHRSDNVWLFDNGTDMIVMSGAAAVALLFASFLYT